MRRHLPWINQVDVKCYHMHPSNREAEGVSGQTHRGEGRVKMDEAVASRGPPTATRSWRGQETNPRLGPPGVGQQPCQDLTQTSSLQCGVIRSVDPRRLVQEFPPAEDMDIK